MVCSDYDGFHSFHDADFLPTRFVGTSAYALLWTHDASQARTAVAFIHRRRKIFDEICRLLGHYADCIHVPHVLLLVLCIHQQHRFDAETAKELATIHLIEKRTGFGPSSAEHAADTAPAVLTAEINQLKH
jgi:hypothetical protein